MLESVNVVELTFLTLSLALSTSYLPISNGPKSKIFSDYTNTLDKYDSG